MGWLAMNEVTTFRWSLEEDLHGYVAAGFDGIGVWRRKLADIGEEKGAELLAESGLKVSSLSWAGGFTGSEGWTHKESIEDASQAIELAATIGAQCLVVHSGARGLHTQNHVRRLFRQALDVLLPRAESLHVTLALEPMHPAAGARWTFLSDLDDALAVCDSYGSSRLKLVLDLYDWGLAPDLPQRMAQFVPHLALVQLADVQQPRCADRNRCPLGAGTLPLARLVQQLAHAGYPGPFEVELVGEEVENCDYQRLLDDSLREFGRWAEPPIDAGLNIEATETHPSATGS